MSFACENGHVLVVEALLANNADVNKRSTENRSPLELAAGSENATDESLLEVVRKLVAAGASLESIDEEDTPLLRAAIAGHALVTRELLDAGSDPDWARESNGETALHVACFEGHAAVVEELARRSTSIDVRKTTTSETALYIACSKGHLDAVKALLKEGVQTDEELNTVPRTGYYPLYIAASNGHAEVVQELQESGCSISTLTTNKDTPLIIAGASECPSASCLCGASTSVLRSVQRLRQGDRGPRCGRRRRALHQGRQRRDCPVLRLPAGASGCRQGPDCRQSAPL